jgi:uncharacterized protein YbjT (DUF2867 family)
MAIVTVLGASGRLGAPATHILLARGHRVRAGVRDRSSPAATALADDGAALVAADFEDPDGLAAAVRGADVVVASGTAHRAGPDGERRHGIALADALARAGGRPLVYISGAGADRPTGVPVLESKRAVEERIAALRLASVILAPAYLMENAFNPWNLAALAAGRFPLALSAERALAQVAIADVAAMAVLAAERARELEGQRIELASDELTGAQAAERLARVTGRERRFERVGPETLPPGLRSLFAWLERDGPAVDLASLHGRFPEVGWHSFERWAATQPWPA